MADVTFEIGSDVRCVDGDCGSITRVVVDPIARTVTHLVVEPKDRRGLARLVPLDLVASSAGVVQLRCTAAEFERLDHAEESQFLPGSGGHADYPIGHALSQPYYGLRDTIGDVPQVVTYDTIPLDEVAVRRGQRVHATDGEIGKVDGLVIEPKSHGVTHVLLEEGHLWGHKQVAIPIGAVRSINGGITLNLSVEEIRDLPPVPVEGRQA
jgi:sporulation protein YlmC with PRC-barrel domain